MAGASLAVRASLPRHFCLEPSATDGVGGKRLMQVCIFGAGAIGGYLAARLARAGKPVSLLARGAHLQAIVSAGLKLETPEESFVVHPRASDDPSALGPQDLVIVATKTTALPAVARSISPLLGPDTSVAFAQNGVFWWYGDGFAPGGTALDLGRLDPDGALHRLIGPERSLGMVVYSPNEIREPGVVSNTGKRNRFVLGEPASGGTARAEAARALLAGAGFEVEVTTDIRAAMWAKLLRNVGSGPLAVLGECRSSDLVDDPAVAAIGRSLAQEATAVAAAHGFRDLGVDLDALGRPGSRPVHKPSILQDLERGRPMEIHSMVAVVQDLARSSGVPTPTLDIVLPLMVLKARTAGCYPAQAA